MAGRDRKSSRPLERKVGASGAEFVALAASVANLS
jgi:hypothetical protein